MAVGIVEEHDSINGLYRFVLYRGGTYTQYVSKGRKPTIYPMGTSIASIGLDTIDARHEVIEPVRTWLCTNLSGRFSIVPRWRVVSYVPITIVFHDASAAALFKMRWI